MLGFWIIAATAAVVTIAILGRALIAGGEADATDDTGVEDVQVYRDQLAELDRDVARGVIGPAEAERARVETSRRLLEADRRAQARTAAPAAPRGLTWAVFAVSAAVIGVGGLGLYGEKGALLEDPEAPWYSLPQVLPDLPLATRIATAETAMSARDSQGVIEAGLPDWSGPPADAPADYLEMVDQLRAALDGRDGDLEGQQLLAQHEGALGNYRAAHRAMARVIEIKGDDAGADDYTKYADLLVLAARGRVSPEAETAIRKALELAPGDGIALYYLGLMYGQNDRPDLGFPIWRDLLERSPADAPWVEPIRGQIGQLAAMAGVDYAPPARSAPGPLAGPTQEDMAAAADMTDAERAEMVRGMVNRLMERLATEGGTPEEWAQLLGALAIIGDTDRAEVIWGEAQSVFAAYPNALALIDRTAQDAGLSAPRGFDGATAPAPTPDAAPDAAPAPAPAMPGPDADDIAAAAEMSAEDRAAMIDGMVGRLADELATDGGPPEKWIMLLNSLGQLGQAERAAEVWTQAQAFFADDPEALARVRSVAAALGVTE